MDTVSIRRKRRYGHTLVESMMAMISAAALMAGMGGTIYIASLALDDGGSNPVQQIKDARLLGNLMRDAKFALSFSELTDKAATFTVPDRDGDNQPETIRYAWSGTPGDPLTYAYNGSSAEVLAEDVKHFKLSTLTRFMEAPVIPPSEGGGNLLFVSGGTVVLPQGGDPIIIPTAQEDLRIALIESWGYTATLIHESGLPADFVAAIAENDVAYVPETVDPTAVGKKLSEAGIGVVNEEGELIEAFGLASGSPTAITITDGSITDNTHYITSSFALGDLALADPWQPFTYVNTGVAPGVDVIGTVWNKPSLMVADTGAELLGGATAAGRRVQLSWGSTGFDFDALNADARTIMQRAIEWGAGAGETGPQNVLFVVTDVNAPTATESIRQALIESWGYAVTLIDDDDTQANYDAAVGQADVAYVSTEVIDNSLSNKLASATIGVVNACDKLNNDFGICGSATSIETQTDITDNTHYITNPFPLGLLTIFTSAQDSVYAAADIAPDGTSLAKRPSGASQDTFFTIDVGGTLFGGGTAASRRVQLPWGGHTFDFNALASNGQTLMKRAIEWAAGASGGGGPGEGPDIYVHDITMGWTKQGQNYYGQATVWIKDDTGADVVGATVDVGWTGDVTGSAQGVTGPDGKIMLESPSKRNGGTFVCTVTLVVKNGSTYNVSLNVETSDSITAP